MPHDANVERPYMAEASADAGMMRVPGAVVDLSGYYPKALHGRGRSVNKRLAAEKREKVWANGL